MKSLYKAVSRAVRQIMVYLQCWEQGARSADVCMGLVFCALGTPRLQKRIAAQLFHSAVVLLSPGCYPKAAL